MNMNMKTEKKGEYWEGEEYWKDEGVEVEVEKLNVEMNVGGNI